MLSRFCPHLLVSPRRGGGIGRVYEVVEAGVLFLAGAIAQELTKDGSREARNAAGPTRGEPLEVFDDFARRKGYVLRHGCDLLRALGRDLEESAHLGIRLGDRLGLGDLLWHGRPTFRYRATVSQRELSSHDEPLLRVYENGDIFRANGKYAKPWTDDEGYALVKIGGKNHYVHRIVCLAFHGAMPHDKPHVNHINGDPGDNRAANLEWISIADNTRRSHATNTNRKSSAPKRSLSIHGIGEAGEQRSFASISDAARQLNLYSGSISAVLSGRLKQTGGWTFELAEDPDLLGEVWRAHPELPISISNMERYQLLSTRRQGTKVHVGSGRHSVGIAASLYYFHRLVWEAFHGRKISDGYEIDHIDEATRSNRPKDLQPVTPSKNIQMSYDRKLRATPAKAVIAVVPTTREELRFISIKEAAEKLKSHIQNISAVLCGKRKTCKGYTFRYVDAAKEMPPPGTMEYREITIASLQAMRLAPFTRH